MPDPPQDWYNATLDEQLILQQVTTAPSLETLVNTLGVTDDESVTVLMLENIATYAASWGDKAAVWLVLAVVRLVREISTDFPDTRFGVVGATQFAIASAEEHQQELAHLCLTGYQEIYDVLLRTHPKPSSPFWHRRAVTQHFPQLILDIKNDNSQLDIDFDSFDDD